MFMSLDQTDLDRTFSILADSRRRAVLRSLNGVDDPVELDGLAKSVAHYLATVSPESSNTDIERIRLELHHQHLPQLAEFGFIEYDQASETIVMMEKAHLLIDILEAIEPS